jgi:transketolase
MSIRTVEEIKLDIAHDVLPVIILDYVGGFVYSHLATTHQYVEDIACTEAIPRIQVISPDVRLEMAAEMDYPCAALSLRFMHIGKSDRLNVYAVARGPEARRSLESSRWSDRYP